MWEPWYTRFDMALLGGPSFGSQNFDYDNPGQDQLLYGSLCEQVQVYELVDAELKVKNLNIVLIQKPASTKATEVSRRISGLICFYPSSNMGPS